MMIFNFSEDKAIKQITVYLLITLFVGIIFSGLALILAGLLIEGNLSIVLQADGSQSSVASLRLVQAGTHIGMFVLPPFIYARLSGINVLKYLNLHRLPSARHILMMVAVLILSIPLIGLLNYWNSFMELPEWLSGMENWMREMEDNNKHITEMILLSDKPMSYGANLFVIALLPAIGEELVFRGILLRVFSRFMQNIHLNIIFVAFLFSALHLQFYGFLPRFALGVLLGYLLYWSGSMLLPMLMHFIFNGITITAYFLYARDNTSQNPDDFNLTDSSFTLVINVVFLALAFHWFNKSRKKEALWK
jgi:membrane protease YdiL (CAAX protease family)